MGRHDWTYHDPYVDPASEYIPDSRKGIPSETEVTKASLIGLDILVSNSIKSFFTHNNINIILLNYAFLGRGCRLRLPINQATIRGISRFRSSDWSYQPDVPPLTRPKAERRPIRTLSPLCDIYRNALEYFIYIVEPAKRGGLRPEISNSLKLYTIIVSCSHYLTKPSLTPVIFAYFLPRT